MTKGSIRNLVRYDRNQPLWSVKPTQLPSRASQAFFSTSSRTFDTPDRKGKGKETSPETSPDELSDSIKSLMRISAQSVGVITSYTNGPSPSSTSTKEQDRLVHGATLSSFTTVSLQPPIVAFSLRTPSRLADALLSPVKSPTSSTSTPAHFIINILSSSQASIASSFAKPGLKHYYQKDWEAPTIGGQGSNGEAEDHPLEKFDHQPSKIAGGVPFLNKSLGALACSVLKKFDLDDFEGLIDIGGNGEGRKSDGSQLFLAKVHAVEGLDGVGNEEMKCRLPLVYWKQRFCTVGEEVV